MLLIFSIIKPERQNYICIILIVLSIEIKRKPKRCISVLYFNVMHAQ